MTEKLSDREFDENYDDVCRRLDAACRKAGRNKVDIILLAATKTVSADRINYAISRGIKYIGENRVQELLLKDDEVDKNAHRHFIGHLQTNKVKDVVGRVEMIESVDSLHLLRKIGEESIKIGKVTDILLEVNIGNESSKSGFSPDEIYEAFDNASATDGVRVCGLMAIPPASDSREELCGYFTKMHNIFVDITAKKTDNRNRLYLSMGMSSDFDLAIEYGADIVRVGTALFGARNYTKKEI